MNKNQIVHCEWKHRETGTIIYVTQKGAVPQTFCYERSEGDRTARGFIGKSELKSNWDRLEPRTEEKSDK